LAPVLGAEFYLAGGVAVASYLHHRQSHDLDLFTRTHDPAALADALARLPAARIVDRAPGTLHLEIGGVPVSLLRYAYPLLEEPAPRDGLPVKVAGYDDLVCMTLSAIAGRGARRDFWDLHALLEAAGRDLKSALTAFQRKYEREDIGHVVRSLSYFADADAEPMPAGMDEAAWKRIRASFEGRVLAL
jgi:hypothetical protein